MVLIKILKRKDASSVLVAVLMAHCLAAVNAGNR
jgi:hypothetical protein